MPPEMVTVKVSRKLLEQLGEWSRPLQVKIEHTDNGYEMITRDPFTAKLRERS